MNAATDRVKIWRVSLARIEQVVSGSRAGTCSG